MTTLTRMTIRELQPADWQDVARIFEEGIRTGNATFETTPPTWEAWDAGHLADHRLVVTLDGDVVGWAALSAVSDRACYSGVAEHSIYVAERVRGLGFGRHPQAASWRRRCQPPACVRRLTHRRVSRLEEMVAGHPERAAPRDRRADSFGRDRHARNGQGEHAGTTVGTGSQ